MYVAAEGSLHLNKLKNCWFLLFSGICKLINNGSYIAAFPPHEVILKYNFHYKMFSCSMLDPIFFILFKSGFPLPGGFNQRLALVFSESPIIFCLHTDSPAQNHQESQPWRQLMDFAWPLWLLPSTPTQRSFGNHTIPKQGRSLVCANYFGIPENQTQTHKKPNSPLCTWFSAWLLPLYQF